MRHACSHSPVSFEVFSLAVCPVKGQVFSSCAGCGTTCARIINDEILFCPAVCREGCTCPGGKVVDTANNECVEPDECPSKSSGLEYSNRVQPW